MLERSTNWKEGFGWKRNIYIALILYILLIMFLFMICRVAFYLYNSAFFPGMTLGRFGKIAIGGLRFDLSAILYLNSLLILLFIVPLNIRFKSSYKKLLIYLFIVVNSIGLALNVADTIYFEYSLRRTTLIVLGQFENEVNISSLIARFLLDYWYAVLFWMLLVFSLVKISRLIKFEGPKLQNQVTYYLSGFIAMVLIIGLVVAGMRGGFGESTRPITLSNAAQYATIPKDVSIVLNTPFALMRTARTPRIDRVSYFGTDEEAEKIFSPIHLPSDSISFQGQNVVVIILESFSMEFFGIYNRGAEGGKYTGHTPFLDSLIGKSRAYQYALANGRKSIDAMPSVICSIPSIEVPFVLSHYSGNKINSLPGLLREKGYYSAFFHGAPNGSMGFQAFARTTDFDDYVGKDEYNNDEDYDGIWGIWDHKFLDFFAEKLNTYKEPFYANFFSVSSHHPYKLPQEFENKFKEGELSIYKCIEYTDYSLKKFFEKASRMPWYDRTLFVITADHASAQIRLPEYNNALGYFSIPLFFFKPGAGWGSLEPEIVQQVDIMPTILGELQYDKPFVAFGRDVFRDPGSYAFNYLDGTYQAFSGDYLLQFDGKDSRALYDFKKDRLLQTNLLMVLPDTVNVMERELKAFIQQYNNRMVDNKLTIEN